MTKDTKAVINLFQAISPQISEQSVCDCLRLEKYSDRRHRPIFVKLFCTCEVSTILASRVKLSEIPGISMKPGMTPKEKEVESVLLKKCRELINSGIESSSIKIRGSSLFVNNKKYGVVNGSTFTNLIADNCSNGSITSQSNSVSGDRSVNSD